MKRYSTVFLVPSILIIVLTFLPGFAPNSHQSMVEELLRQRTAILQDAYTRQVGIAEAEEALYEIETQPLLGSDVSYLRKTNATDFEFIRDLAVTSLEQTKRMYHMIVFQGEIQWFLVGPDGSYSESVPYCIVIKDFGKTYKLSEFNPLSH